MQNDAAPSAAKKLLNDEHGMCSQTKHCNYNNRLHDQQHRLTAYNWYVCARWTRADQLVSQEGTSTSRVKCVRACVGQHITAYYCPNSSTLCQHANQPATCRLTWCVSLRRKASLLCCCTTLQHGQSARSQAGSALCLQNGQCGHHQQK